MEEFSCRFFAKMMKLVPFKKKRLIPHVVCPPYLIMRTIYDGHTSSRS